MPPIWQERFDPIFQVVLQPTLYIRISKGYTPEDNTEKNFTSLPKKEASCPPFPLTKGILSA
jgi:hypothetical protein